MELKHSRYRDAILFRNTTNRTIMELKLTGIAGEELKELDY